MKILAMNTDKNLTFNGKLPKIKQKQIKAFTLDYLKNQDGYVSSRGSVSNGVAILMRGLSGTFLTGFIIEELPKMIQDSLVSTIVQVTTGLGSLAVAMSRLENDRAATGQALTKLKPYLEKLKAAGFNKNDELIYGTKQFLNKKGGFYTSIVPNTFSTKRAEKIFINKNQ